MGWQCYRWWYRLNLLRHNAHPEILFFNLKMLLFSCFLKGRERYLPSVGLLPKCLQQQWLGQAEMKSQEFHSGLPWGSQEPKYVDHHLLPPMVCISRNARSQVEVGPDARHSDTGCKTPKQLLNLLCQHPLAHFNWVICLFFVKL